ncbi:MAG: carbohydrate binding family 9 domain-containing protein, partial [Nitrospinaceae bacterium]|nr:carbohydrate binding family 9 domain-containing protein [Nitrospinaceae bacterium]
LKNRIFEITRATGSIIVDADLDDVGWVDAASTDFFLEIQPGDNVDPPDPTEVKVTYDKDNLYVAFMAYSDPDNIRATLQKRDQAWRDDFVAIIIDAYGDANAAVMVGSNPLGVQMDALNQGQHDDDSYDIIYESAGKITDNGFQVEMAIPFSSLSFPKKEIQEWKVTFFRSFPRDARHMVTWGGLDRSNPCWLCQLGTLKGIQGIEQKGKLEFLPTLIGSQSSELDENNALKKGSSEGEVSMGIKYSLSSDRVAEIAINPDFSQVEADEEQIDVNTTFALNYQEKRPFFNEGADLTDTPVSVVYTRSINNPTGVGRIINRGKKDSWLLLSALDEDSPYIVPGEEQSFTSMGSKSFSNIFRYKRSLNEGSFLGFIATDRRMVDNQGSGSVVGFDTRYRFNDTYQVEFQSVFSHTQEPNDLLLISSATFGDNHTFAFDGESFSGNALKLEFDRNTEHWRMEVGYDHRTPTFRAENGFVTNANNRRIFGQSLWIYFPNNFFSQVLGGVHAGVEHNFDGVQKAKYVALFSNLAMPRQTRLNVMYSRRMQYRFKDTELKGTYDIRINLNSQFSERY